MCWLVRDGHVQGEKKSSSWPKKLRESAPELGSTQLESLPHIERGWGGSPVCAAACSLANEHSQGCVNILEFIHLAWE